MKLSKRVDENDIISLITSFDIIIVGSDQIWNPTQRNKREYFLGFENVFKGKKISYAADSTISKINPNQVDKLKKELKDFNAISVRNEHTRQFVKILTGENAPIVADPTLLYDFKDLIDTNDKMLLENEKYILVYVLGKDINQTNKKIIEEIKKIHGNLKVYSIIIPTMKFNVSNYADKIFYDLNPKEWLKLFQNATFIYTDSYHGTLFSLKFHKRFLAYYAEEMRATRFRDLGKRYEIDRFIVSGINDIKNKNSLNSIPDFEKIDQLIEDHKEKSVKFMCGAIEKII